MADSNELIFEIKFDIQKMQGDIAKIKSSMNTLETTGRDAFKSISDEATMQAEAISSAFSKVGAVVGGIFSVGAAKQFLGQVINIRSEFQDTEARFKVFLGNEQKAAEFMSQLSDYAYWNTFEFKDLAAQSAQLLAFKNNVEDVIPTIDMLSNIASGTGVELERLVSVWNKVKSVDKIDSMTNISLKGMGIDVAQVLADAGEQVDETTLKFEDLKKAIETITGEGGLYHGIMEAKMETSLSDQVGLLQDSITAMFNEIGESSQGAIKDLLLFANSAVQHYKEIGEVLTMLISIYGSYKVAMAISHQLYMQEKAALEASLTTKNASMDADLAAAVAKGKLTAAEAAEIQSLRTAMQEKLKSAQATLAQAQAEESAAKKSYMSATQRKVIAKQNLELATAQMKVAMQTGTIEEQQAARISAYNAKLELQNAAIAKNNAHKALAASTSNTLAASEAVEATAKQVSTVATGAEITKTTLLTAAKAGLQKVTAALNKTVLSNPYALAAAAIIILIKKIYELATAESRAEKNMGQFYRQVAQAESEAQLQFSKLKEAQDNLELFNDALKKTKEGSEEHKKAIEDIKKGTTEYNDVIAKLKELYPDVISKHIDEAGKIRDIAAAYDEVCRAIKSKVATQLKEQELSEDVGELVEEQAGVYEKIRKQIAETYPNLSRNSINQVMTNIKAAVDSGKKSMYEIAHVYQDSMKKLFGINANVDKVTQKMTGVHLGAASWAQDLIELQDEIVTTTTEINDKWDTFIDNVYSSANSKPEQNTPNNTPAKKSPLDRLKEELDEKKKLYDQYYKWVTSSDEELNRLGKEGLSKLKDDGKTYLDYLYSIREKYSGELRDEINNRLFEEQKNLDERVKSAQEAIDKINEDLKEKRSSSEIDDAGETNPLKKMLGDEYSDYLKNLEGLKKQEADYTKNVREKLIDALKVEFPELTEAELEKKIDEIMREKEYYAYIFNYFATLYEKESKAHSEREDKIIHNLNDKYNEYASNYIDAVNKANKKKKELEKLGFNEEYIKETLGEYSTKLDKVSEGLGDKTKSELSNSLSSLITMNIEELRNTANEIATQLSEETDLDTKAKLSAMLKATDKLITERQQNKSGKSEEDEKKERAEKLKKTVNDFTVIGDAVNDLIQNLNCLDDEMKESFQIAYDTFKGIANTAVAIAEEDYAAAAASAIGTVVNLMVNLDAQQQKYFEKNFDSFNEQTENAIKGIEDKIKRLQKAQEDSFGSLAVAYSNLVIKRYREQIEEIEKENTELQRMIENCNYTYEQRQQIEEEIAENNRQIYEIEQQITAEKEKQMELLTGYSSTHDAVEAFGDAIIKAWENGTSAAGAAMDTWENMLKNFARQKFLNEFMSKQFEGIFNDYYKQITGDGLSEAEQVEFQNKITALAERGEKFYANLMESMGLANDIALEGTKGSGIAKASQESIDELNGRFLSVQMFTASISGSVERLYQNSTSIMRDVSDIRGFQENISGKIDAMNGYMQDIVNNGIRMN